jgi:hypothetical protein
MPSRQCEHHSGPYGADKAEAVAGERVRDTDSSNHCGKDYTCEEWRVDPDARKPAALPSQIAAGEFQEHEIGGRHDGGPCGGEIETIADDESTQIEPLTDPVDQAKGSEPRPSDAVRGGTRDREAGDPEQDEGKPVEEQDEVCLFCDEVCHFGYERLQYGLLAASWHPVPYVDGGALGTICLKFPVLELLTQMLITACAFSRSLVTGERRWPSRAMALSSRWAARGVRAKSRWCSASQPTSHPLPNLV